MASSGGSASPRKPWEGARSVSSGPSPFRPASSEMNSTAAVVESAGVADSADKNAITNPMQNGSMISRPSMLNRGYGGAGYSSTNYNQYNNNAYGMNPSYGSTYNSLNRGYGSGMYGGGYGSYGGGGYGGGMYGSNYGSGMYGSPYSMGMTNMGMGGMGMGMGGMGMGMGMGMGGPGSFQNGSEDPNNPFGSGGPPSFWQSLLQKLHWMVVVFGNVAGLVSENTQTFNVITSALFQFFERSGMLVGYVLKLLRLWSRPKVLPKAQNLALPAPRNAAMLQIEGPKSAGGAWDNVWSNEAAG